MIPLAVICGRGPMPDETFVRRDLTALASLGWAVKVFGLNEAGRGENVPSASGGAVLRRALRIARFSPRQSLAFLLRAPLVSRVAAFTGREGLVLAEFSWLTADIAAAVSLSTGCPWACAVHAWDVFTRPSRELRIRLEGAGGIIACSRQAGEAVALATRSPRPIHLVHHGLPLGEIAHSRSEKRPLTVCAVGRLEAKKGFDILLAAWPLVRKVHPGARLALIGEGPERRRLGRLASRCGGVTFLGRLPERAVWSEIVRSEVLVLPSRRTARGDRDGIANVLLEAMALRTAVVTTDAGAAGEVVVPDVNGILIPADGKVRDALAASIVRLLSDAPFRLSLADEASRTISREFDLAATSVELDGVLRRIRLSWTKRGADGAVR